MITQVFLAYHFWEDWREGMWRDIEGKERQEYLGRSVEFMADVRRFGHSMTDIVRRWPNACLHSLSNDSINRRAWLGQAACCLGTGSPEDITRQAWHKLTEVQQKRANARADKAIELWESQYRKGIQSCLNIG